MEADRRAARPRVVIVGGGFGGLRAARQLRKADVDVLLVDQRNYHLFQPLLYQVATGALSPANIATPLRSLVSRQRNCQTILARVTGFDLPNQQVLLEDGTIDFDYLIVAAGARHSYFGRDDWEPYAPGLKTIEDATEIRKRILSAFEKAERLDDAAQRLPWLTFVIVGGGPTGVELAGALSEIARHTLRHDFRTIRPADARIVLLDASDRALSVYPEPLSRRAEKDLQRLGVQVRAHCRVTGVSGSQVQVHTPDGEETIECRTIIWAAGVAASPLARALAESIDHPLDRAGRIQVNEDLSLPGYPHVFCIGDMAHCKDGEGRALPGLAPVAMQQGIYAAEQIVALRSGNSLPPFQYRDRGSMAVIGRYSAVALVGSRHFTGLVAWLIWLVIHLVEITQFQNRLLVMIQWGYSFFTHNRSARLITQVSPESDGHAVVRAPS